MPYITKKSQSDLIADYTKATGKAPTWLGKIFGWASTEVFYYKMESWASFIDALCPDWFPISVIEGFLKKVVKSIYNSEVGTHYYWGAQEGDKIVGEFEKAVSDTKAKIDKAISDARTKIETDLINPIKAKIAGIEPKVSDLLSKVKTAEASITDIQSRINEARRDLEKHTGDITELFERVKTLEKKATEQKDAFEWLRSVIPK